MSGMYGSDADDLDSLAVELRQAGDRLQTLATRLRAQLHNSPWEGHDADAFRRLWNTRLHRQLLDSATMCRDAESRLRHQAAEQREASGAQGSADSGRVGSGQIGAFEFANGVLSYAPMIHKLLESIDFLTGVPDLLRMGRIIHRFDELLELKGLPHLSAMGLIKVQGGHIPYVGTALSVLDVALNWQQHGGWDARTLGAAALGIGGVAAFAVAGPLGGLAWTAGTSIGQAITDTTQVDETLASGATSLAYGDRHQVVPEMSAQWYRSASPEAVKEYTDSVLRANEENAQLAERAQKPWLFAYDVGRGLLRSI